MNIGKISHIGIAVENIEQHLALYRDILGLPSGGTEIVEDQGVKVAFFEVGDSRLELLEATAADSPVGKFLEKRGGKPAVHHIALCVPDVEAALETAKKRGARLVDEQPRRGAHGTKIAFLHPKTTGGILIELCQEN